MRFVVGVFLALFCATANPLSLLFIGNSYTFLPGQGDPDHPALPEMIKNILQSIDPSLVVNYKAHTPGFYSFQQHFADPISHDLLSQHYDNVILQGQSIESLELTPIMISKGFVGVQSFAVYLPKILDLVYLHNDNVTLYVNWGWNPKHVQLQDSAPGLTFPGAAKAGQKWCGANKYVYQHMIDVSYRIHASEYPVQFARVGDEWIALEDQGVVSEDELYLPGDWSHPSVLGSYIAALTLIKATFHMDLSKNQFVPAGLDPIRAARITALVNSQ